ncbi:hypothetical protein [Schumannella sp. 10F1B-5-1]|uniref:hypothetical protein n=1 Tax=Schumannella sp. 10F1B-5-1 TaxID=2590780 RepID=UPI00113104C0|nr:hypothetical protein [Schumannella sp. 10F1B-5-1]TPW70048.1 hypothetical protein FJ658_13500 [Schumannella sp. 10F1B-5-1]
MPGLLPIVVGLFAAATVMLALQRAVAAPGPEGASRRERGGYASRVELLAGFLTAGGLLAVSWQLVPWAQLWLVPWFLLIALLAVAVLLAVPRFAEVPWMRSGRRGILIDALAETVLVAGLAVVTTVL